MKKSVGAKTLPMPAPVWVVGTYDGEGKANVMTAAWVGICCSKPPCVAVSLRKATYSYGNIVARQAFTISVPPKQHVKTADYWGLSSGRDVDKFAKAGLTAVASNVVDAPVPTGDDPVDRFGNYGVFRTIDNGRKTHCRLFPLLSLSDVF